MYFKNEDKILDQGAGRIKTVDVCITVKVKISEEAFEKLEAEGSLGEYLSNKARKQIDDGKGDATFFDFRKQILAA